MSTNFITVDELKQLTAISQNVDVSLLVPFIQVSEEMNIYPILGTALVTELLNQIDTITLTPDNEKLLNEYIIPFDAWSTFMESSIFLLYRTVNKGLVKNFGDNSTPLDRFELSQYRQSINDRVSFYKNRLVDYLNTNKSLFPLYRPDCGSTRQSSSTGIWLG